ncbi:MAG: hypothetical protein ACKO84_00060 [Actinomycetota bacterium]
MTKLAASGGHDGEARCRWCRRVVPARPGPGRPREFCNQACRQWDWVGRQRARELKISENELVVTRRQLEALYDDLYVLACAVADTDLELSAGRPTVKSLQEALQWLLDAARPLCDRTLDPASSP